MPTEEKALMFKESRLSASSKLLVVADDPDNRHALSRRLAHRGYAVEVAENGAAVRFVSEKSRRK